MINLEHLWFSYTGAPPYVVSDIDLTITNGEYISIIGENGCGKTTLMRILLGFLKPTKGSVSIHTNRIGYVPQRNDFTNVNFPITVYEVLYSYFKLLKLKDKKLILDALKRMGMEEYANTLMGNLSGGQTQKVLIARALLGNPELLILDEPSTGVDIDSQKEIYALLKHMSEKESTTIVAVEHNLQAVFENSTQILHLQNGHGHLCNPEKYTQEYFQYRKEV